MKCLSPLYFSRVLYMVLVFLIAEAPPLSAAENSPDSWEFHLAPYAWLAGQSGSVATLPGLPPADIDIDFYDDILGNINGAFMLVGEARKGSLGIVVDAVCTDIESDTPVPGQILTTLSSRTTSWIFSAAGFYRLFENSGAFVDIFAGVRYWSVESELGLQAGTATLFAASNSESWVDPMVGVKGLFTLGSSRFFVSGFLMAGGFGVGSDLMWDINANIGYQWTKSFSTTIGYRYLDVDYEDNGFLYDVSQDGILMGLSWKF